MNPPIRNGDARDAGDKIPVLPIELETQTIREILFALRTKGWVPAILHSECAFLEQAGVDEQFRVRRLYGAGRRLSSTASIPGDLFFRESDLYYLIADRKMDVDPSDASTFRYLYERESLAKGMPFLQIGVISTEVDGIDSRLQVFGAAVEDAAKETVEPAVGDAFSIGWSTPGAEMSRLDDFRSSTPSGSEARFEAAILEERETTAADVLASPVMRDRLRELSRAGFARRRDVLDRAGSAREQVSADLERLKTAGLVTAEHVVECKKTGSPLSRLGDSQKIESEEVGALLCPHCGSPFKDEALLEGYSLSHLGRKLNSGNYWMTVWVTTLLSSLGVPMESVLWGYSESGEEVDIIVDHFDQLWIFELKDREFGAGDAHPFNYRQVRYHADRAVIVTTDKISPDARQVFEDLGNERRRTGDVIASPVFVEGLENADARLREVLSKASIRYAPRRVRMLGRLSGFDLSELLEYRFGESRRAEELQEVSP